MTYGISAVPIRWCSKHLHCIIWTMAHPLSSALQSSKHAVPPTMQRCTSNALVTRSAHRASHRVGVGSKCANSMRSYSIVTNNFNTTLIAALHSFHPSVHSFIQSIIRDSYHTPDFGCTTVCLLLLLSPFSYFVPVLLPSHSSLSPVFSCLSAVCYPLRTPYFCCCRLQAQP